MTKKNVIHLISTLTMKPVPRTENWTWQHRDSNLQPLPTMTDALDHSTTWTTEKCATFPSSYLFNRPITNNTVNFIRNLVNITIFLVFYNGNFDVKFSY